MFAVLTTLIIIWIVMWGFFKFMYPRPPKSMMPKKGDVTTPRNCDYCGHSLAEYRGVLESPPDAASTQTDVPALFFCNYEHQAEFHQARGTTPPKRPEPPTAPPSTNAS
ncbi:hypothetical protein [Psychrobacter aestuarii]|uniref:Uncharacterized protein n=1 Tax=Psychrobacter aestuarii TaxID=556327 RepID=A0ABP3FKB2_9GAMM|nr:hypothetical protein [Psychrobacter aestuarii]